MCLRGIETFIAPAALLLPRAVGRGLCALEGLKHAFGVVIPLLDPIVGRGLCALEGLKPIGDEAVFVALSRSAAACVP